MNESLDRFLFSINWNDAYECLNENCSEKRMYFIEGRWMPDKQKLDVYFGNFTGSFYIDPSWSSPSSVEDFCGEEGSRPVTNVIDGNTGTYWGHYLTGQDYHWIIEARSGYDACELYWHSHFLNGWRQMLPGQRPD